MNVPLHQQGCRSKYRGGESVYRQRIGFAHAACVMHLTVHHDLDASLPAIWVQRDSTSVQQIGRSVSASLLG
ncbi:hypothetical protein D3C87_1932740 [compost metagenome]